jgi:hypothetical protein
MKLQSLLIIIAVIAIYFASAEDIHDPLEFVGVPLQSPAHYLKNTLMGTELSSQRDVDANGKATANEFSTISISGESLVVGTSSASDKLNFYSTSAPYSLQGTLTVTDNVPNIHPSASMCASSDGQYIVAGTKHTDPYKRFVGVFKKSGSYNYVHHYGWNGNGEGASTEGFEYPSGGNIVLSGNCIFSHDNLSFYLITELGLTLLSVNGEVLDYVGGKYTLTGNLDAGYVNNVEYIAVEVSHIPNTAKGTITFNAHDNSGFAFMVKRVGNTLNIDKNRLHFASGQIQVYDVSVADIGFLIVSYYCYGFNPSIIVYDILDNYKIVNILAEHIATPNAFALTFYAVNDLIVCAGNSGYEVFKLIAGKRQYRYFASLVTSSGIYTSYGSVKYAVKGSKIFIAEYRQEKNSENVIIKNGFGFAWDLAQLSVSDVQQVSTNHYLPSQKINYAGLIDANIIFPATSGHFGGKIDINDNWLIANGARPYGSFWSKSVITIFKNVGTVEKPKWEHFQNFPVTDASGTTGNSPYWYAVDARLIGDKYIMYYLSGGGQKICLARFVPHLLKFVFKNCRENAIYTQNIGSTHVNSVDFVFVAGHNYGDYSVNQYQVYIRKAQRLVKTQDGLQDDCTGGYGKALDQRVDITAVVADSQIYVYKFDEVAKTVSMIKKIEIDPILIYHKFVNVALGGNYIFASLSRSNHNGVPGVPGDGLVIAYDKSNDYKIVLNVNTASSHRDITFGAAISCSNDGNRLVIGSTNGYHILEKDTSDGAWTSKFNINMKDSSSTSFSVYHTWGIKSTDHQFVSACYDHTLSKPYLTIGNFDGSPYNHVAKTADNTVLKEESKTEITKSQLAPVLHQFFDNPKIPLSKITVPTAFTGIDVKKLKKSAARIIEYISLPGGEGSTWTDHKLQAFTNALVGSVYTKNKNIKQKHIDNTKVAFEQKYTPARRNLLEVVEFNTDVVSVTYSFNSTDDNEVAFFIQSMLEPTNMTVLLGELSKDSNFDDYGSEPLSDTKMSSSIDPNDVEYTLYEYFDPESMCFWVEGN